MKTRIMVSLLAVVILLAGAVMPGCGAKALFEVTSLAISPDEVAPGQKATVSATVKNVGQGEGIYEATLTVDGETVETEAVSLGAGSSQRVSFVLVKDKAGTYRIEIGGLKDTLKVAEPAVFEVTSLAVSPDEVGPAQEATVTAVVKNAGQATGDYSVSLTINGAEVETKDITVPGGTTSKVTFAIAQDQAGTYDVRVGDATATLTVKSGFYRSTAYGFSTTFPESWTWQETGGRDPVVEIRAPNNLLVASIYLGYLPEPMSLEDLGASTVGEINQAVPDSTILSQGEILLADSTPAYEVLFTFEQGGSNLKDGVLQVVRGTQVFTIVLLAPVEYFDSNRSAVDEFFASFRLEESQPFGVPKSESLTLYDIGPHTLDPALVRTVTSAVYVMEIFSGLVTFDQNMKIVPDIADKWEASDDGKTYTFYLRKGVRFHSGREVTASDFKYSMERACDPDTDSPTAENYLGDIVGAKEMVAGEAEHISGIKVIDDYTLEITIDAPKTYFLAKLNHHTAFVVDRQNVESDEEWWREPNGTGPFKLREWQEDELLILERNDLYYREPAKVGYVVYRLWGGVPIQMYETDEIDMASVRTANIERVLDPANPLNKELTTVPRFSTFYIGFNHAKPPFDDAKVRQAFSHAVDKDKIISIVLKDMGKRADGILPPGFPGYNEGVIGLAHDLQQAKDLIAESRYKDVSNLPSITFTTSGRGEVSDLDAALVDMWRQNLGVEVQIRQLEPEVYFEVLMEEKDELFGSGWSADYPDPENFLDILFHTGSEENTGEYSNPEIDALLEQARVEQDETARMSLYQKIEQMMIDDAACLPLYHDIEYVLIKPYLENVVVTPLPMSRWRYVSIKPH